MADINVLVDDRVDVEATTERVTAIVDQVPVNVTKDDRNTIRVVNKYKVVPDYYATNVEYIMPDAALNYVSQTELTTAIVEAAGDSKVYVDNAMIYTEEGSEGTMMQKLAEIDVNYLSTGEAAQYALIAELDTLTIAEDFYIDYWDNSYVQDRDPWVDPGIYDNDAYIALRNAAINRDDADLNYPLSGLSGTLLFDAENLPIIRSHTQITAQHIYDQSVRLDNSMATYYENIVTLADDQSAQATKTESLSAIVGTAAGELISKDEATIGFPADDLGGMMASDVTPPVQGERIGIGGPLVTGDKYVVDPLIGASLVELTRVETEAYIASVDPIYDVYTWMGPFMRWRLASDSTIPAISATKYSTNTVTGATTGWSFSDGDGGSNFMVAADNFSIVSPTADFSTAVSPFVVNTETDTVEINGDLIVAGSVSGDSFTATTTISGPIIIGGRVEGVNIIGSVIKSSWIDYATSGILTDWPYVLGIPSGGFLVAAVPPEYADNFAHENTYPYDLVEDFDGYARLQGFAQAYFTHQSNYFASTGSWSPTIDAYKWDTYTLPYINRAIKQDPVLVIANTMPVITANHTAEGSFVFMGVTVSFKAILTISEINTYYAYLIVGGVTKFNVTNNSGIIQTGVFTVEGISFSYDIVTTSSDSHVYINLVTGNYALPNWGGSYFSQFTNTYGAWTAISPGTYLS